MKVHLIPKSTMGDTGQVDKRPNRHGYSCLISTLADDEADYTYWNRAFWVEFPESIVRESAGKTLFYVAPFTSLDAGHRAGTWNGVENVVRVAQCIIPDHPRAQEILERELLKFGPGSWMANLRGKSVPMGTSGYECGYWQRLWLCKFDEETRVYYDCVPYWKCGYYVFVHEDPIGGGGDGGEGFPSQEPGACDPLGTEVCFNGPGGSSEPVPDPCSLQHPPDYCRDPNLCLGNPLPNPAVTPSNGWNISGGMYGYTRSNGNQFHDGIDLSANVNSDLFSMHGGTVIAVNASFAAGEYRANSYGNTITVQSIIDGQIVRLTYAHLNSVRVSVGEAVYAGQIIGNTGNTGNAQSNEYVKVLPHVHVKARILSQNQEEVAANPNNYMATKYNPDGTVNVLTSTCNQ